MGARKWQNCLRGHPLVPDNLVFNSAGFRACRICARRRNVEYLRRKRAKTKTQTKVESAS